MIDNFTSYKQEEYKSVYCSDDCIGLIYYILSEINERYPIRLEQFKDIIPLKQNSQKLEMLLKLNYDIKYESNNLLFYCILFVDYIECTKQC